MRDQMQRAAVSIAANIAEGYERGSRKEYIQFLNIAKGSVGELRCLLTIASRLHYLQMKQYSTSLSDDSRGNFTHAQGADQFTQTMTTL